MNTKKHIHRGGCLNCPGTEDLLSLDTDFYNDLPGMVCEILEILRNKFEKENWFEKAWDEYRHHVLTSNMDEVKMPGFVFNKYIEPTNN